jgi:hypothetical protein
MGDPRGPPLSRLQAFILAIIVATAVIVADATAWHPMTEAVAMAADEVVMRPATHIDLHDGRAAVIEFRGQRRREREAGEGPDNYPGQRGPNQNFLHRFLRSLLILRK